jgi:hypothetical protein
MLGTTTPVKISEAVLKFCAELDNTQKPLFLRPQPHRKSIPNECFSNVREHISSNGGSMQLGWLVWETPGIMLEATLHGVWCSSDGALVDVTPQADGEPEIMFLPDSTATIDANTEVVGMRRYPLVDDPLIRQFIRLAEKKDAVKVRTQGRLTRPDLIEMTEIESQQIPLQKKLALKYRGKVGELKVAPLSYRPSQSGGPATVVTRAPQPVVAKVGRNDPCPCGSGKKYKRRHGKKVKPFPTSVFPLDRRNALP